MRKFDLYDEFPIRWDNWSGPILVLGVFIAITINAISSLVGGATGLRAAIYYLLLVGAVLAFVQVYRALRERVRELRAPND